jgi:acetyl esterase
MQAHRREPCGKARRYSAVHDRFARERHPLFRSASILVRCNTRAELSDHKAIPVNGAEPLLDGEMTTFLALIKAGGLDPSTVPIEAARRGARELRLPWNRNGPAMAETHERVVAGLRCRLHVPEPAEAPQPFTIYLHGGGWTLLDIDTHDDLARRIARESRRPLLLVDYPLAPEHRFPVPLMRLKEMLEALPGAGFASRLDLRRFVLSGDSAGANLALALALLLREAGGARPDALALLYGSFAPVFDTASHHAYGAGALPLTTARMRWFWDNYAPDDAARRQPLASPVLADLEGLPPIFLGVAQHDILFDENMDLAARLGAAGVDLSLRTYPGTIHGFAEAAGAVGSTVAGRALAEIGHFIAGRFDNQGAGAAPVEA